MQIGEKEAVGAGALVIGWLLSTFSSGRKIGKIEAKFESRLEAAETTITEHAQDISGIKKDHKDDMERIRSFFSTPDGGARFLTFPVHEGICDRNTKILAQEIKHLTEALRGNTAEVRDMKKQMGQMTVAIAVLEEVKDENNGKVRSF